MALFERFWKRVPDRWLTGVAAKILFGIASALIAAAAYLLSGHGAHVPKNLSQPQQLLFGLLGGLTAFGTAFLWGGMWWYWQRMDRSPRWARRLWFLVLLLGIWYGGVVYYLFVYLPQTSKSHMTFTGAS